jgi:hypothetical protein
MPLSDERYRKSKLKARDCMLRLMRWELRWMRDRSIGSPRAYRFDKKVRAFKSLFDEITPEKYKALNAAQQEGALRGAERWCERGEDVIRPRPRLTHSSRGRFGR